MRKSKKGFTIIELMLAMLFLSMLLVTIALLIIQITDIYQKGLSLRAVSSEGKQLIDEFKRVVGGSPLGQDIIPESNDWNKINEALSKYFVTRTSSKDPVLGTRQASGAFCTGSYSYVWNTKYSLVDRVGQVMTIDGREYRLARVMDSARSVCTQANSTPDIRTSKLSSSDPPIEMLNPDESDLILYDFTVFPATQQTLTGQSFYSATFILATIKGGVDIQSSGDYCEVERLPSGVAQEFNYCAVNKFNFAMRATGYAEGEDMYGETGDLVK